MSIKFYVHLVTVRRMFWAAVAAVAGVKIKMEFERHVPSARDVTVTIASVVGPPLHAGLVDICEHRQTMVAMVRAGRDAGWNAYMLRKFQDALSEEDLSVALDATVVRLHVSACNANCSCRLPRGEFNHVANYDQL